MDYLGQVGSLPHERRAFILLTIASAMAFVAGCDGNTTGNSANPQTAQHARQGAKVGEDLKGPAIFSFDNQTGTLERWPIQPGGSQTPTAITSSLGISSEYGMAMDLGIGLAIASYSPQELVTYSLSTHTEMVYPDPGGPPIDIAVAKGSTIYMLNSTSVVAYPLDRSAFRVLTCQYINNAVAIAVDKQGDIFVNGYGPGSFMGVVEYPYPPQSQSCVALDLNPEQGLAAGIGVDPATDNLIVVDDPGSCAGSSDGRMTIYSRPYGPNTGIVTNLNGTNCAGTFRLDSTSQNMFVYDSTPSGGSVIDQLSYPNAQNEGSYSGSGPTGGFTNLPNTLPN